MTATSTTAVVAEREEASHPADFALSHRQIVEILSGLMLGMFLAALDQTIVATAIRTIGDDLHGLSVQAWVTTAYLITATITTPLYGKLSDIYGRKPFFLLAISLFIIGSALCAFATSMYMLAGFRAVQGVGAGGLFSLALAIVGDIVPPRERARYQGYFLAVFGTSSVLGPVIGGFFAGTDQILGITGWRWVFLVNVPIGLVALAVVARVLNVPHRRRDHRLDILGAIALAVGVVPLLTVAEQGRAWGWASDRAITCYVVGVVGLLAFIWAESRVGEDALIPLRMFRDRTFAITSVAGIVVGMGMFGGIAALPLYLQIVRGASPTEAGLLLVPLTVGIMTGSIFSGQLISRTGRYKVYPILGALLMIVGMVLLSRVGVDTPFWQTSVYMGVFGFGLGNIMQPITLAMQNAMPRDMGVATAAATFFRQMGGTLGTAVFLSVLFSTAGDRITGAFRDAARTPAFQQAVSDPQVAVNPANAPVLDALRAGGVRGSTLDDTSFLERMDPTLARPFKVGFSESMDLVFLLGAAVLVVALLVLLFLPSLPLRAQAGIASHGPASPLGERPPIDPGGNSELDDAATGPDTEPDTDPGGAPPEPPDRVDDRGGGAPLSNSAVLTGEVEGPDGRPLAGAALTVTDLFGHQLARGLSGVDGRYRLELPTGGTYLLICSAENHQPAASLVAVATGEVRRDVTLVGASTLEGRVLRQSGEPASGATVTLTDARGEVVGAAVAGTDGEYELADLNPGDYTLTATALGARPVAQAVSLDGTGGRRYDLVLASNGALAGAVLSATSGAPVREASVALVDGFGNVAAWTLTGEDGWYDFRDLPPGTYTLTASGYAPVAARVEVAGDRTDRHDVVLGAVGNGVPDRPTAAATAVGREG
ncbi:MAG TPA: MFS transporter [Mycobacteriales bacterium]|jgi:EmrB/QacA subfamily drug resistance transporter|nr:MFS transporter [Mycobacteriales bacterium]